ncbi:ammonium transporter [Nocardioides sp. AN3]
MFPLALAAVTTPATAAAAAASADPSDTAWLLAATAMVLVMVPGLALFYGGMVRSKGVLNMMMMTFVSLGVVTVVWVVVGYSLAFGDDVVGGLIGDPTEFFGLQGLLDGRTGWLHVPLILFAIFQGLFAVITGALVSGAIADRARFGAWVVFVGVWTVLVYAPVAHWVFDPAHPGDPGGWLLNKIGLIDFAGGTAVEVCSGASALALALVVGRRIGFAAEAMRPHNLTLVMLGAGLLWFGWFGFNAGSALEANRTAADVIATTLAAGAAGTMGWLTVERVRDRHATTLGAASGMVAGLVAITPSCASLTPLGALVTGGLTGAVCAWAIGLKYRWGYDDSLDVVGVHMVGGIVGTLGIGLLASAAAPTGVDGLFYGGGLDQLGRQLVATAVVLVYSFAVSGVIGLAVDRFMGFRIHRDDEMSGIDLAVHAETAYDLHTVGGTRPHRLV